MSTAEPSDNDSASEADWSVASDASGMFETFLEPPQQDYHDYVNTGATLTLNAEISRPALTHPDSTRLIVVQPASNTNAPVRISFAVTTLANPRAYCGFSYAWGPTHTDGSHLTDTVYLDSLPLRVTGHLHNAFKNIRRHAHRVCSTDLLTFWIDTLCINQQDVDERNSQVMLMGRIYARARAVLLWIGTLRASTYRSLKKAILLEEQDVDVAPSGTSPARSVRLPADVSDSILDQAYFSRRWVIQEVLMQPNRYVLVADQLITFESLQLTIANCGKDVPPLCQSRNDGDNTGLLINLIRYSSTECSDPPDRLFALLASSQRHHGITPDYSKSYVDLYTGFAVSCIRHGQLPTILACAVETRRYSGVDTMLMPSWVPDWRQCLPAACLNVPMAMSAQADNTCKLTDDNNQIQFDAQVSWVHRQPEQRFCEVLEYLRQEVRKRRAFRPESASDADVLGHIGHYRLANFAYMMCVVPGPRCVLLMSSVDPTSRAPSEPGKSKLVDWFPLADTMPGWQFEGLVPEALYPRGSDHPWESLESSSVPQAGTKSEEGVSLVLVTWKRKARLMLKPMTVLLV
ncbi:hypothetical protein LTR17_000856 [Elasticomyces elasticus]|nr:hypothetical protein LTR17_000856 [Elasticomyces elasticus]